MNRLQERQLEDKERRRAEIVQAAADLAYEQGWDQVTVGSVAKRARLSRALVYLYFKDKVDLHAALWERACSTLHERFLEAVGRHQRGYDKLEAMGNAYVAFALEMPHYFEAMSRFESRTPEPVEGCSSEVRAMMRHRHVHDLMVETIQIGFKDGSVRTDAGDPHLIAVCLWGFTHGIIQIATTKANELARDGISQTALVKQAFSMIEKSLQSG